MSLTANHARYFARELTKRSSSASIDTLTDAQVDLNPHQVETALFAFHSPLSRGVIHADEIGLGKTIKASILFSQRWAERHRRLFIICPANLRKQRVQELADKFFHLTTILEAETFNEAIKRGNFNPLDESKIILCSFLSMRKRKIQGKQTDVAVLEPSLATMDWLLATFLLRWILALLFGIECLRNHSFRCGHWRCAWKVIVKY